MVIDFHTHTFPDKMVGPVIDRLAKAAGAKAHISGTVSALSESMRLNGIDYSVVMPIATKPGQHTNINNTAALINESTEATGVLSFGSIHPDDENYREIIDTICSLGIKGIKLHPVYQKVYFDDTRFLKIMDYAAERGLIITTHAGLDISTPGDYVTPEHIIPVLDRLDYNRLILAHTGSWNGWDEVYEKICGRDVFFDTSFSLVPKTYANGEPQPYLENELFLKIVEKHGFDHILFGTDSPWTDQGNSVDAIKKSGLSSKPLSDILGDNAAKLLGL